MPGHGYSTHIANGFSYSFAQETILVHELVAFFKWNKLSLLGHSIGAVELSLYASWFPDKIDYFIGIDMLYSLVTDLALTDYGGYASRITQLVDAFEEISKQEEPKSYPYDKCVATYCKITRKSVTPEHASYMLERGLRPSRKYSNQYYFSCDIRAKILPIPIYGRDEYKACLKKLKAPLLLIKAEKALTNETCEKYFVEMETQFRNNLQSFEVLRVKETHHVQLTAPESIGPAIYSFIRKYDSKDREQRPNVINEIKYEKARL